MNRIKRASSPNQLAGSEGTTSLAAAEPSFDRADAATSAMVVVVVEVESASVSVAVAVEMLVDMIDSAAAATDAVDSRDDIVMDVLELSQSVVLKGCTDGRGIRSDNSGSCSSLGVTPSVTVQKQSLGSIAGEEALYIVNKLSFMPSTVGGFVKVPPNCSPECALSLYYGL